MERLTSYEWMIVQDSLTRAAVAYWENALYAYNVGEQVSGDFWARRIVATKSAYDKLMDWPWEPEQEQSPQPDFTRDAGTQAWRDAFGEGSVS